MRKVTLVSRKVYAELLYRKRELSLFCFGRAPCKTAFRRARIPPPEAAPGGSNESNNSGDDRAGPIPLASPGALRARPFEKAWARHAIELARALAAADDYAGLQCIEGGNRLSRAGRRSAPFA